MQNKVLKKKDLSKFVANLLKKHEVWAPVKKDNMHVFDIIRAPEQIDLGMVNTIYSPRKVFLPYKDIVFDYKKEVIKENISKKKRAIIGIRPCDVHGLIVLDKLFLAEPVDPIYKAKRENTLIIAINCSEAGGNCFCTSMNTCRLEEDYDLLFTEKDDKYIVEFGSDKGKELLKSKIFKNTNLSPPEVVLDCPKSIRPEKCIKLKTSFDNPIWKRYADICLSCGACTVTCTTCPCFSMFDVPDLDNLETEGKRVRRTASCQIKNFTRAAGNHIFREKRSYRVKNRIYHKLDYFKDKFGIHMCTGCGRCITNCPTGIDITKIMEEL